MPTHIAPQAVRATRSRIAASIRHAMPALPLLLQPISICQPAACLRPFSMRSGPPTPHGRPASFATPAYSTRQTGTPGTIDWRLFLTSNGKDVSPWHDVPLLAQGSTAGQLLFNYINEIPKGSRPKMEIATKEPGNPIRQDVKKGHLRLFTFGDLPFNYGCIPQTWENPHETHVHTQLGGDNDPLDAIELGGTPMQMGSVHAVKVLGVLGLLDEGETDWKILCIAASHPLAESIRSAEDIETHFPGAVHGIREWLRNYKTTDGKPQNRFAFEEQVMDVGMAQQIIWETHAAWAALCRGEIPANELAIPTTVPKAAEGE